MNQVVVISLFSVLFMLVVIGIGTTRFRVLERRRSSEPEHPGLGPRFPYPGGGRSEYVPENYAEDIDEEDRDGFFHVWSSIRERFDNDPRTAIIYADLLLSDLILQNHAPWHYEADDFAAELRAAHEIAVRGRSRGASPEDLAKAMGLFSHLFDRFLVRPVACTRAFY